MSQPHNLDAERAVLGAVLVDNALVSTVEDKVSPEHFYREAHQRIYRALVALGAKGSALDLVTVSEALEASGDLEAVGPAYVADVLSNGLRAANIDHYAAIVREKAIRRSLIRHAETLVREAKHDADGVDRVIDAGIQSLIGLSGAAVPGDLVAGSQLASEALRWLEDVSRRRGSREVSGGPTGFPELDAMTDGFQPGDLVIVGARPSQGKSALALQFALAADGPCAFFSLEMRRDQLSARALATLGRVDGWAMRRGMLRKDEYERLQRALEQLGDSGLAIDESAGLSVPQMTAKARRWQLTRGLRMVVCDYLQLMTPGTVKGRTGQNREQEVAGMTRALKMAAKELQVPVLVLAQLNRGTEATRDKEPTLANLRESGAVEQDADLVLLIHRADGASVAVEGDARLIVAKNRMGPTGGIDLRWYPTQTRFGPQIREGAA